MWAHLNRQLSAEAGSGQSRSLKTCLRLVGQTPGNMLRLQVQQSRTHSGFHQIYRNGDINGLLQIG